jgi:hypothetical protein
MTQLDLLPGKSPIVTDTDVGVLVSRLHQSDWITARELRVIYGYQDRTLRAIANASKGEIITSQKGYKLNAGATGEERKHAANWLRH